MATSMRALQSADMRLYEIADVRAPGRSTTFMGGSKRRASVTHFRPANHSLFDGLARSHEKKLVPIAL